MNSSYTNDHVCEKLKQQKKPQRKQRRPSLTQPLLPWAR